MHDAAKALVRDYVERVWTRGDFSDLEAWTTDGYTYRLGGQPPRDRAAMVAFLAGLRVAFPDWRVEIETAIAEHDVMAVQWTGRATHEGPFHGIAATGKEIEVGGISLYRIEDGRIAAEWEQMDSLGLLAQLGALPPSP